MYAWYIICILITIQKNASKPKPSPPASPHSPAQLLTFFLKLLPRRTLLQLPALSDRHFYDRLFTPMVTLWYLLFQRLNADHTLDAALSDARTGGADRIRKNLSRQLRSDSTCSYSDARQRLPWPALLQALSLQAQQILRLTPTLLWHGLTIALIDGSTVRLRPHPGTAKQLPPQRNQHPNRAYWCLLRVVVDFCALSGAALDCAMGSIHLSEQQLACQIILGSKLRSLFLGDRNFGVFRIVQVARHAGQEVLLRLTERRARKLLGRTLQPGQYSVNWKPSSHDQLEPGCSKDSVPGRLLIARVHRHGFRPQKLCLFTTLPDTQQYRLEEMMRLYGLRWHIELNLRYLKAQMGMVQLEAKSPNMARKEWLAGLMAYNLVRAAQLCAALQTGLPPLSLSFCAVRRRLEDWLAQSLRAKRSPLASWACLLQRIAQCRLPRRRKPRPSEPRAQRHLRLPYPPLYGSRGAARKNLRKYVSKS